jgi:sugar/nucleoside kinase (ribokinase family)
MFAENAGLEDWTLADLAAVANLETVFAADAVCCSNWISLPALGDAFHELGDRSLPRVPFVLDPGDIVGTDAAAIESLHDALAALQHTVDVVYNANRQEIRASAATLADTPTDDYEKLRALREATGVEAVVMHATDEAAAATADGLTTVETRSVASPTRFTGGGDRFTGGLGLGLAADWDWELALAAGNACASHYVETGETATVADLRAEFEGST